MMFVYFFILLALGCQGFASVDNMRSAMPVMTRNMGTITSQQKAELMRMWQMPALKTLSKEEAKMMRTSFFAMPMAIIKDKQKTKELLKAAKALGIRAEKAISQLEALNFWKEGKALKGIHWLSQGEFSYKPQGARTVESGHYKKTNRETKEELEFRVTTSLVNDPVISTEDLRTLDAMLPVAAPEGFEKRLYGDAPGYKKDPDKYYRERPTLRLGWQMLEDKTIGGGLVIVSPTRIPNDVLLGNKYKMKRFIYYKGVKAFSVLVILEKGVI